jgi:hypothetical protein
LLICIAPAQAIQPQRWTDGSQADFAQGKFDHTVATNLSDVKLASNTVPLANLPDPSTNIYDACCLKNGDLYIAAGPEGRLYRRHGDKLELVLTLSNEQIFKLGVGPDGRLLLALSGSPSRVAVLDGNTVSTLVELRDVRYIWDMLVDAPNHQVFLATGTSGRLLLVDLASIKAPPAGAAATTPATAPSPAPATQPALPTGVTEILHAQQSNLLCLGRDGRARLYVGTDTDGLIYRLTPPEKATGAWQSFVMYDAAESEIAALLVLPDGTIYAGTGDAEQAKATPATAAATEETGRPEKPAASPATKPAPPATQPAARPANPPGANAGGSRDTSGGTSGGGVAWLPQADDRIVSVNGRHVATLSAAALTAILRDNTQPLQLVVERSGQIIVLAEPTPSAASPAQPAEPTKEQRDRLREIIRERLEQARTTGAVQLAAQAAHPGPAHPHPAAAAGAAANEKAKEKEGNAIYRIDPYGFVTEVFRENVIVLKVIPDPDAPAGSRRLLVATGNQGQIFRVDPAGDETTIIAQLAPEQVSALALGPDGRIVLGTSNPATLVRLDPGYAKTGTYTSKVLDAAQVSLWGMLHLTPTIPDGCSIAVETRSGNVEDPDHAPWSAWSKPTVFAHDPALPAMAPVDLAISPASGLGTPPARFLQYRLTVTGDGNTTPAVRKVEIAYVVPNLRPEIKSIRGTYANLPGTAPAGAPAAPAHPQPPAHPGGPAAAAQPADNEPPAPTSMTVEWEASDPNNDHLRYTLEYAAAGTDKWISLIENTDQTGYEWQTRRVPDGRYLLRITAGDWPDNPPDMALTATRLSDPVLVNNTPPQFAKLQSAVAGTSATVTAQVVAHLCTVASLQYAVDSATDWKPALPDDMIFDSTTESCTIKITVLKPGAHVVTLRATDSQGNTKYQAVALEVK